MSTAMRGFIHFCKKLKPKAVILNGDVMDFPQISRHDPLGWESHPLVIAEIRAAQKVLLELEKVSRKSRRIWTLGNHDARFERRLAEKNPEYKGVTGVHLKDHFPKWEPCWSVRINDKVEIKHNWLGGDNAPFNNTVKSGLSIITGHLHSAKVIPYTDFAGTRYGVDAGCLCDPNHDAFLYTANNSKNWRAGFCVLTFRNGRLLQPQLALVHDSRRLDYRGELINV